MAPSVQESFLQAHVLSLIGTIRSAYRMSLRAKVSSRLTHSDLTDDGERITTNQSHRESARPISSCHCCAPTMFVELSKWECRPRESHRRAGCESAIARGVRAEDLGRDR